jgi:hypothetical protein
LTREALSTLMADFLAQRGLASDDIDQKVSRAIRKLRDCGFKINSAPNRPYELVESSFPVLLSPKQHDSLALAAYILSGMGFSVPASDVLNISKLSDSIEPSQVKVAFSPPVDYSEAKLEETVKQLQERLSPEHRQGSMPGQTPHGNLGVLSPPVAKMPHSTGIYRDFWLTFRLIIGQSYRTVLWGDPFSSLILGDRKHLSHPLAIFCPGPATLNGELGY